MARVGKALGKPVLLWGLCDDPVFERGFRNFVAAACAVKAFRELRILQIRPQIQTQIPLAIQSPIARCCARRCWSWRVRTRIFSC